MRLERRTTGSTHFRWPRVAKRCQFRKVKCGVYIVNKGSRARSAVFGKRAIWETPGSPFCLPFWSLCHPFCSRWRIFERSGPPLSGTVMNFGTIRCEGTFLYEFCGSQGDPQVAYAGMSAGCSGHMGKQHFDPLGDDIVWVSAQSAIFHACAALNN